MQQRTKPNLTEATVVVAFGVLAFALAGQLADHDVGIAARVAVFIFTITTGLYFAFQIRQGLRTTIFTCPTKGCPVFIRACGTSQTELTRLKALATDHSQHGST